MDKKKTLIGLSVTTIILLSLFAPMLLVQLVSAAFPYGDYVVVEGVLATDYYALYPFEKKSLKVGFSKYGELIGIPAGLDPTVQANWVGFEYDGRDPFCPPTVVPMETWFNGWFIDIHYTDPSFPVGSAKRDRHLWAFAMFSDSTAWGGDWINGAAGPGEAPHGGRKTNGYAVTEPLKVLYDGPRLFVAESVTHLYDVEGASRWPVVDVIVKMIFEKVKKQVILIKDVKITIPKGHIWGVLNVQLSNREQYDLGPAPSYDSYADFFPQIGYTCYGPDWHTAVNLTRDYVEYETGDGRMKTFTLTNVPVKDFMKIWIDGKFVDPTEYTVNWNAKTVTFASAPKDGAEIKFMYKYVFKEAEEWDHAYDIAQVISSDKKYVAWTAFWPPVSDYVVDGMLRILEPLIDVQEDDMWSEPKQSPVIIGEWDFILDHARLPHFRCVEVKGIANLHDAVDDEFGEPTVDSEAWYLLDEVFNPWDLVSAVHKQTWRWVEFFEGDGSTSAFKLSHTPFAYLGGWAEYCSFRERVLVDGKLIVPWDAKGIWPPNKWPNYPYYYYLNDTDEDDYYDEIVFWNAKTDKPWAPASGAVIKVLYSTYNIPGRYEWVIVGRDAETVDSAGAALVTSAFKDKIIESEGEAGAYIGLAGADMKETAVYNAMPSVMRKFGTGNTKADYKDMIGRAALKDDWCTTWPVASSNMIAVGGPLANMLAYYANDFTPAFFGLEEYAASVWDNKIIALTCWSQNTYESTEDTGYAVVATYKDLNGTVIFLVWGHWGRDTYYATKWLHEEGIYQLQSAPRCATAIILEIDYTVHEPAVSIVEVLGTISETLWTHNDVEKGGIHIDP
ncbi:MAG: hypothetical protein QXT30_03760 [Candidatus Bathyarchaeia archaeon]